MDSSNSNERIKYQTFKIERDKSEKEEVINPQIEKSKRENNTNDDTPVYNYPYEFYEEEKIKKEEINIQNNKEEEKIKKEEKDNINNEEKIINNENKDIKNNEKIKVEIQPDNDIKILEQKEITKEIFQKIENIPENVQNNTAIINQQINKNERAFNLEENKIIKNEEMNINKDVNKINMKNSQKKEEKKTKEIVLKNMDKMQLKNPPMPREEYKVPKVKEIKLEKEIIPEKKVTNLHKSKFTQKTENDYNLMMKQLKNKDYKNNEEHVIKKLISGEEKILSKQNNKNKPKRKDVINDFLQRNQDYIEYKQNMDKTINERFKIANENIKKRIYFDNKENEQKYFEEFYNNQIQFMNNCQTNLDRLTQQINEENEKKYIPEPKNKTNLNYFKNKNSVELSKYKAEKKLKQENKKDTENEKEKENPKNTTSKIKPKLTLTNPKKKNSKDSVNKLKDTKNDNNNNNTLNRNQPKLTRKEIDELTNKLHYEGELLKVKKQTMISEEFANNPIYHNFSKDKLSRSSIIILIKKFLYEYTIAVKNNTYIDAIKNPKINYEQYIDILKDLYYIEKDALPEDYLEDDTMYKELWDKLTKFSKGPENSLESNILLLYILELNGFFRNEKIIKELEPEIHWIKLGDYDELIANAKYIEENWDDLKLRKIENIKKLKSLKIYNPIHNEEIYTNNNIINNTNLFNPVNVNNSNHYITIIKGNTNYELIHGYSTKKKNEDNDTFSEDFNDKKGKGLYNSLTLNNKNKISLQDGFNDIILQKKLNIENKKQEEERKLREICTFKPSLTIMRKSMFNNNAKVDLPKHRINKSVNISKSVNIKDNINNNNKSSLNKDNSTKDSQNEKNIKLRKHKSNLQKMFNTNPLKNDKIFNERIQILKSVKSNEINEDNYLITPMRFNIDYPSKFEDLGVSINRDSSLKQSFQNIIFYNIKVNDKIRTMKFIEGDDLKLNVINFVRKNKLPDEVVNIILNKIKEKELEEKK